MRTNLDIVFILKPRKQWLSEWDSWSYSALQKNLTFLGFSYKMPIDARVENYPNVMINAPIFAQLIALMWGASQWVLVTKFPMVFELQVIKFVSKKKSPF